MLECTRMGVLVVERRETDPSPVDAPAVEIALPVFNEERVLETSVRRLHRYLADQFPFACSIVVIDNASTDDTLPIAHRLAAELGGVRVVHLAEKGRGRALRAAWTTSTAAVVAYMDIDLSTGLDALLPLVAPLLSGHSDVAIGNRLGATSRVARGPRREVVSRAYNLILRTVFAARFHDAQCGFKAVRREIAGPLLAAVEDEEWFFDTELLLLSEHNGLRVHEVPVDWIEDPDSRVDVLRTARDDLRGIARVARWFMTGRGHLDIGSDTRPPLDDDMGRSVVGFALVGAASTLVTLALFVALRAPLGSIPAVVVALAATTVGNAWAHRRFTLGRRGREGLRSHVLRSGVLAIVGGALSVLALVFVHALGGGILAEIGALVVVWTLTAVMRLSALSREAR
jgi:putative flippase GtrA